MIPRTDRSAATSTTPASSKVLRCRYRLAWGISGTSTASCLVVNTPRARAPIRRMRCGCRITSLLLVPIIGNVITSENRQLAGTVLFSAYQADPVVSLSKAYPAAHVRYRQRDGPHRTPSPHRVKVDRPLSLVDTPPRGRPRTSQVSAPSRRT